MKQRFCIIAALRAEVADILADGFFCWRRDDHGFYHSQKGISLGITGVGKASAVFTLGRMFDLSEEFLIVGTSGTLCDEKIGSLYLVNEFVEHDMDAAELGVPLGVTPFCPVGEQVISTNSSLLTPLRVAAEKLGLSLAPGRLASGDQFINEKEDVERIKADFGANLVDMESAAVAKICRGRGKNFAALRYVSDNANCESVLSWNENVKISSAEFNQIIKNLLSA